MFNKEKENTHICEIYFPRDPEESFKNESIYRRRFNIEIIIPRYLVESF